MGCTRFCADKQHQPENKGLNHSSLNVAEDKTIGFIGAGNMAQSMIGGLVAKGLPASQRLASDPSEACRATIEAKGVSALSDNAMLIAKSDFVVLAVKPQLMQQVLEPLAQQMPALLETRPFAVISIAAGISCSMISRWLGVELAVIRCMPNTPALLQTGATGLYANSNTTSAQRQLAEALLEALGIVCWVESEKDLDTVTALSGSGPAYFFLMLESMVAKAVEMGLPADVAQQLAIQTALGSARMAQESDVDLTELKRRVTSPNGTTEAALKSFQSNDFAEVIAKAMLAASARAESLEQELA